MTTLARLVAIDADQHATFLPTVDLESVSGVWELIAPYAPGDRFEGTNIEELIDAGHLEWVSKLPNKIIGSFKLTPSGRASSHATRAGSSASARRPPRWTCRGRRSGRCLRG